MTEGGGGRESAAAGVGFVRPRQWGRGQSPRRYHLSQSLLGFRTRRTSTGRLVNPILVHSPASQRNLRPTRLLPSLFEHPFFLFLSPSGRRHPCIIATHHCYTHVSRVISAVDDRDFFSTFRDNNVCE